MAASRRGQGRGVKGSGSGRSAAFGQGRSDCLHCNRRL